jgi:hypothetical protein
MVRALLVLRFRENVGTPECRSFFLVFSHFLFWTFLFHDKSSRGKLNQELYFRRNGWKSGETGKTRFRPSQRNGISHHDKIHNCIQCWILPAMLLTIQGCINTENYHTSNPFPHKYTGATQHHNSQIPYIIHISMKTLLMNSSKNLARPPPSYDPLGILFKNAINSL